MDGARGVDLWNIVREAGRPWNIGPGNPNPVERIESGLLSYGGDTDDVTNPFEVRLGRYVDLDLDAEVIGITALRKIKEAGIRRQQLGLVLDDQEPRSGHAMWYEIHKDGAKIGDMTNGAWSFRLQTMIGFALVGIEAQLGDKVEVMRGGYVDRGTLCDLPFFRI